MHLSICGADVPEVEGKKSYGNDNGLGNEKG